MSDTPRAALVTGAGSGLGQLIAWRLARAGTAVTAVDVHEAGLAATAADNPDRIRTALCDVSDPGAVAEMVTAAEEATGPLERVVNAAAIARVGPTLDMDPRVVMTMMSINYGGTVNVCAATIPGLLERRRGAVVNFASIAGWIPQKRMTAYAATKFAVVGYTEGLWAEYRGGGVTFHCVCPSSVRTAMTSDFFAADQVEKSRPISPEKVVAAVEKAVARDRFLVFPGPGTGLLYRARRHTPRLVRALTESSVLDIVRR